MTDNLPTQTTGGAVVPASSGTAAAVALAGGAPASLEGTQSMPGRSAAQTQVTREVSHWMTDLKANCPELSSKSLTDVQNWFLKTRPRMLEQHEMTRALSDDAQRDEAIAQMRQEWGANFDANIRAITSWIGSLAPTVGDFLRYGRSPNDGRAIANTRAGLAWMLSQARGGSSGPGGSEAVGAEIKELERMMGDKRSRYWRGAEAEQLQARYRELIDHRDGR